MNNSFHFVPGQFEKERKKIKVDFCFEEKERKSRVGKKVKNSFAVKMLQGPAETFVNMSLKTALLAGGNK